VGGVGGALAMRRTAGITAVETIAKTKTDWRGVPTRGESSWPIAPPIGLAIAMSMVAVVRPLRSNHFSEYMGPRTWKTGCAIAVNIFEMGE
jgi:hypothetical protein